MGLFKWWHEHGHKPVDPKEFGPGQHVALVETIERRWISVELDEGAAEVAAPGPLPPEVTATGLRTVGKGGF